MGGIRCDVPLMGQVRSFGRYARFRLGAHTAARFFSLAMLSVSKRWGERRMGWDAIRDEVWALAAYAFL